MKNFTSGALFHLRDTDIGRSITELVRRLDYDRLQEDADTLLRELTVVEREVTLDDGTTFIMSLHLYRTVTQAIDGVIIIFRHRRAQAP